MHGRLIDADALRFEIINKPSEFKATEATIDFLTGLSKRTHEVLDILDEAPTVDAVPVVHGRWIEQERYAFGVMYDCSICDNRILDNGHSWNYCPNCGAKMDGKDDENG